MSDRHVRGNPGEEPEAAPPRTRRRLPLRIAEVREVQAPGGGDMGICADC